MARTGTKLPSVSYLCYTYQLDYHASILRLQQQLQLQHQLFRISYIQHYTLVYSLLRHSVHSLTLTVYSFLVRERVQRQVDSLILLYSLLAQTLYIQTRIPTAHELVYTQ